jgi:hypothetical protein
MHSLHKRFSPNKTAAHPKSCLVFLYQKYSIQSLILTMLSEENISFLAGRPAYILEGESMIKIQAKPVQHVPLANLETSSIGNLDVLPLEILQMMMRELDFRSLMRLSHVSKRGWEIVDSLPEAKSIMKHAYPAMVALSQTTLIKWHSISTIYGTMRSPECTSCGDFGPFLFLPTCQRCCFHCLEDNQSFWVISVNTAIKLFNLDKKKANREPILRAIPGSYSVSYRITQTKRQRGICVQNVKRMALELNGPQEVLKELIMESKLSITEKDLALWIAEASLEPLSRDPRDMWNRRTCRPIAHFHGMASIPFPFVHGKDVVEHGLRCAGCLNDWETGSRPLETGVVRLYQSLGEKPEPGEVELPSARRARTKDDFIKHVSVCPSAQRLLREHLQKSETQLPTA